MDIKKLHNFSIIATVIVLLFFSENNFAQYSSNLKILNLKLSAGKNISVSDYIETGSGTNYLIGGEYLLSKKGNSGIGLSIDLGYRSFDGKNNNLGLPELFNTKTFSTGLGFTYCYSFSKQFSPYLQLGTSYLSFSFSDKNYYSKIIRKKNGQIKNSFTFDTKAGLKYFLSELFTLNFEIGFHSILNDNLDAIKIGIHNDYFTDFNIGISYNLLAEKDSDNDGIYDSEDKCPEKAEDIDGFQDDDGCPDLDNDNDGIPDDVDLCVNLPEDIDGFQDDDGCPDLDNDKDGIPDINDKCPNKAEDFDGFEDNDGCPDLDNDNDGIPDVNDKCPNAPENINGYLDDDGCPDVIPFTGNNNKSNEEKLKVPSSFILNIDQTINKTYTKIKNSGKNKLDQIVKIMKQNPQIYWRIEGHVDKMKSSLKAIGLSKKLVKIVRDYLISKGIAKNNLQISAMGDSSPIANNNTVFGRMKNRRIKIIRLN